METGFGGGGGAGIRPQSGHVGGHGRGPPCAPVHPPVHPTRKPTLNSDLLMVKPTFSKWAPPQMAEMRGVMNDATVASTSLENAPPTTKATAMSTMLPRSKKSRKPVADEKAQPAAALPPTLATAAARRAATDAASLAAAELERTDAMVKVRGGRTLNAGERREKGLEEGGGSSGGAWSAWPAVPRRRGMRSWMRSWGRLGKPPSVCRRANVGHKSGVASRGMVGRVGACIRCHALAHACAAHQAVRAARARGRPQRRGALARHGEGAHWVA